MKIVNCNNLFYRYVYGNKGSVFIPITDKLKLANGDSLYYGGPDRFYHRLAYMLYYILYEGGYFDMLYNILDENNYFDEDDQLLAYELGSAQ